jgi:hypothetical protein
LPAINERFGHFEIEAVARMIVLGVKLGASIYPMKRSD